MALPLFQPSSLSVSGLTRYLRELLEADAILQDVWVQGEISNFTRASSGHVYLTLKDAYAALKCVIWRTTALRIRIPLQNGMAVEAHGAIGLYERDGAYQLYIDAVRPAGEGYLYQEFLRLKARLEADGLFEESRKRPLPALPQRIGLVTSPTGAALQDMLNTLARRYPLADVLLAPSPVQGDEAPPRLVAAIQSLNRLSPPPDVIILARGGGSIEDLWAFNDESVVRAVAASAVPIVTGVGHETDVTLVDFAADLRAPTPTGAAALATPDRADLIIGLERLQNRLVSAAVIRLGELRAEQALLQSRLLRHSPERNLLDEAQRLDAAQLRLKRAAQVHLSMQRAALDGLSARLKALNPLEVLQRGYALVQRPDGSLLTRAANALPPEPVQIRLADGTLTANITHVEQTS
ncbi:MAG: exodeoxyribonuclease VII large subunit [Anaerolineae bacterium]|nr:exodeoxyribonuclease VII large subunit [Anaerolineae bacterium]